MMHRIVLGAAAVATLASCGDESTGPDDLAPVASLAIAPIPDTLLTRQRLRLAVEAFDRQGSLLSDRPVVWESADPALVSVTAGGVLTAVAPGTVEITALAEDAVDTVTVTVRALSFEHMYAGSSASCGLEASGDAWCWGRVGTAGYGNGPLDTTRMDVPIRAASGHSFSTLALGNGSACGVETSGGVVCWGQNDSGQLGDGTTTARGTPAPVGGLTGIVELAAGASHFCARSSTGAVSCWGSNEWLQGGQPARGILTRPASVTLGGPASRIMAGYAHTCALTVGTGFCWGTDAARELGNDTTYDRLSPAPAATGDGASRTWSEVEASNGHTCGRDTTGAMFCWGVIEGRNDNDTLVWSPARRLPDIAATDIAGGWFLQCAVSDQQVVWCDGRTFPKVELAASGPAVSAVVAGSEACVLQTDGAVECEVSNTPRGTLTRVPLPAPAVQLTASDNGACALDEVAAVHCWSTWESLVPHQRFEAHAVTGVYGNSGRRICVTTQSTTVSCRSSFDEDVETTEPTGGVDLVSLAVGDNHTCGLTASGATWCWGTNDHGQLGDGTLIDRSTAVAVSGGHVFTQITAGYAHTCGLTADGAIHCWGYGSSGAMGDDKRDGSAAPVDVDGVPDLTWLTAGIYGGCGLDAAGSAWCWPESFSVPGANQVGGATGLVTITGPCGLRPDGEMLCWGDNWSGWFGDGTYNVRRETAVPGGDGLRFSEIGFSLFGTACGITLDGANYCWGSAIGTSLGSPDGNGEMATLPVKLYGSP